MSDQTSAGGDPGASDDQQPREHSQDPSEGAAEDQEPDTRAHSQDPAEGGDDSSATA